jgi:phosphomannomutase
MIHNLVVNTLIGLGIDVIDLGLSTTPTVEIAQRKQTGNYSYCLITSNGMP